VGGNPTSRYDQIFQRMNDDKNGVSTDTM